MLNAKAVKNCFMLLETGKRLHDEQYWMWHIMYFLDSAALLRAQNKQKSEDALAMNMCLPRGVLVKTSEPGRLMNKLH